MIGQRFFRSCAALRQWFHMMMSALKVADELSAAAVTRGLENPKPRTCLQEIHFSIADVICVALFSMFMSVSVWLKLKGVIG